MRTSRFLALAFAAAHLAAAAPLLFLTLPNFIVILWAATLMLSLATRLVIPPVSSIRQLPDGQWLLSLPGREQEAELVGWYAHPWLCVAQFRAGWRFQRAVVVPWWVAAPDVHRRLRVALRAA